jgi:hypothetical protein
MDSVAECARVLLAATRDWQPGDGNASTVANARTMLAQMIYALDGKGFPAPVSDAVVKQPALRKIWKACLDAARSGLDENGKPQEPVAENAVFWISDSNNSTRLGDRAGLGLNWPFQPDSHVIRWSGPILDGADPRPKRLFFFDEFAKEAALELDADAGPGFWPRSSDVTAVSNEPVQAVTDQASGDNPRSRPWLATALFVVWGLSGLTLAIWLWTGARAMANAAGRLKDSACLSAAWTGDCGGKWSDELHTQLTSTGHKISDWIGKLLWTVSAEDPHLVLQVPFVLTMGSILTLMLAAGLATKGLWFGVLIDERNRISLSRTQQIAWTVLVLGALAIMGWCNAAAFTAAQTGWALFPTVPSAIWAALGINLLVTPYLSDVILKTKDQKGEAGKADRGAQSGNQDQQSGPALMVRSVVPARLQKNEDPARAKWADLITGETAGTQQELDVSRIQHVVISGALLTSYLLVLLNQLGNVQDIVKAFTSNASIFSAMPNVDGGNLTFLGLLGLSHSGYLWFKSKQPEGSTTTSEGGQAQAKVAEAAE